MPEYLAPGVFVEETSFRNKSIEGVSTTTTGFIGPTRYGPVDLEPEIITSLGEFERTYGDRQQLQFEDQKPLAMHNWMWHSVRAFFEEGGKRLYVARTFNPSDGLTGYAHAVLPGGSNPSNPIQIKARFPGHPGNTRVRLTLRMGQNVLGSSLIGGTPVTTVGALQPWDVVFVTDLTSPIDSPPGSGEFYVAETVDDTRTNEPTWQFTRRVNGALVSTLSLAQLSPAISPGQPGDSVRVVTLTVSVERSDENGTAQVWASLPIDPRHKVGGSPDSVFDFFSPRPANLNLARTLPVVITLEDANSNGLDVLETLFTAKGGLRTSLAQASSGDADRTLTVPLSGGHDGNRPVADDYEGENNPDKPKTGLKIFEDLEDISIVAAPGSTFGFDNGYHSEANTIVNLLVAHASKMRYRIAVIDSGDNQAISQVRAMRARLDSTYAALYYPWVRILDPVTRQEIHAPPSGFVAGIYARNDINRAVYKAPANEVVNLAIGFERFLNKAEQEVLNPEGINCFRFFEGRGFRLWGARTTSSDPEWKYVNLRRYFAYLERSIDKGTQWAVFEPNGEALWANVRRTIEDFLLNEWQSGALLGDKPEKAFFVKCDRTTMTQNDLDNGRLICLIGVAPLKPAEFVIFRIGQWTSDRKS